MFFFFFFLGSLVQSCCGEGGAREQISLACSPCFGHTGFAPAHSTAQTLGCSAGNCLRRALGFMPFPGLSRSGSCSRLLHKGADLVGPAFCAHPRPEQLRRPGAWRADSPPVGGCCLPPPSPSLLVFWVYNGHAFSSVLCVYSGELVSGCNPPGGCQSSRIPRSRG